MSGGLTYWWAKDAAWWRRGGIVRLLAEFGPTGPAVIDYLSCEAKAQNDGGLVTAHPYAIAHGINADDVTVSHVVSRSVTLGLLDDYEQHADRFSCRLSGWNADQERVSATERKAAARARALAAKERNGSVEPNVVGTNVTASHGESRDVPECPLTGTGTGTEGKKTSPPVSLEIERLCDLLSSLTRQRLGLPSSSQKYVVTDDWRTSMRLLVEKDRAHVATPVAEVEAAIRWVDRDSFWSGQVLSPGKLRAKYDQLVLAARERKPAPATKTSERDARFAEREAAAERVMAERQRQEAA